MPTSRPPRDDVTELSDLLHSIVWSLLHLLPNGFSLVMEHSFLIGQSFDTSPWELGIIAPSLNNKLGYLTNADPFPI